MDADDAPAIGARARMIRRRRRMSLDVAAGLASMSESSLAALERGQRGFTRRGLIEDLAAALGCSVADLTGQPYLPPDRATADAMSTVPGIELAVCDGTLDDAPDLRARPVTELARLARQANAYCDETRYALAGRDLAAVLGELHVHAVTGDSDTRRAALAALVEACLTASGIARALGHSSLAVAVARRGYDAAERRGDPALTAFAAMSRAGALTRVGARHRAAKVLGDALAAVKSAVDPTAADNRPAQAAGMLHLASAELASHEGRGGDADTQLAQATELARATGECNDLNYHFGPANVAAWSVAIGVELERGSEAAERAAADVSQWAAVLASADRRSFLHVDIARGWAQAGGDRDAEAIRHLDTADRIAPTRIRNDPIVRELALTLDRRARRRVGELNNLRDRFGIGGERPSRSVKP
ncbi:MAG: helix-turn-helix domain-containing protein [Pseudonocardiales bacterium]|nr:helix-turn-helix domain-containing protein [Pseudonocardiales bacterium]